MSNLILQKSRELVNNLYQIKPTKSRRNKRWDAVGTVWKWIAGSPDAEDLRIINRTFNGLIDENNEQVKVNSMIDTKISEITSTVNKLIERHSAEEKLL